MPNITLTNTSAASVDIRSIYVDLAPGQQVTVLRTPVDLMNMTEVHKLVAAGQLTMVITPTPDEIGSGFVPYPGLGPGDTGNTFIWDNSKTWASIYADILTSGGSGIVLVTPDGDREMTPNPAGVTDLSNLFFIGLHGTAGSVPIIRIDSALVGGFWLGGTNNIQSKDIQWETYYQIGDSQPACWSFDGGGLSSATKEPCYRHLAFSFKLSNGATTDGTMCDDALIIGVNAGANVTLATGAFLGPKSLKSNKGVPPFPGVNISTDASSTVDLAALEGTFIHAPLLLQDKAERISYDDSLVIPPLGNTKVQGALDYLKTAVTNRFHTVTQVSTANAVTGIDLIVPAVGGMAYLEGFSVLVDGLTAWSGAFTELVIEDSTATPLVTIDAAGLVANAIIIPGSANSTLQPAFVTGATSTTIRIKSDDAIAAGSDLRVAIWGVLG